MPWNANIQYDALLARLVAPAPRDVLEVGCGDGFLSARLAEAGHRVVAVDLDAPVLERARARWPSAPVEWRQGDVLELDGTYDAVVSNATLHHLPDTAEALAKLGSLVRPGGLVAVVGFARNAWYDWPFALVGQAVLLVLNVVRRKWEHSAPQHWPPPGTYAEVRRTAAQVLPASRFRRLLLGRYLLVWERPSAE